MPVTALFQGTVRSFPYHSDEIVQVLHLLPFYPRTEHLLMHAEAPFTIFDFYNRLVCILYPINYTTTNILFKSFYTKS